MQKIKIALDVSPTVDGNSVRGVGYYTNHLIKALQQEIKTNPKYKNWSIDLITNSYDLRSKNYDLTHYPYFDPFKLTLPRSAKPTIVTVHDLIPLQFKSHFPAGIKGNLKWFIQRYRLQKAAKIITVSNYSKQIISKIVNYPSSRIFSIYEGADDSFKPSKDLKKLKMIKEKYSLPDKFTLFVGDINWNKNIPNLVRSCLKLKYPLVIVGSAAVQKDVPDHPWTKDIRWLQSKYKKINQHHHKKLIFTGFVSDEDLPFIYNLATIYCQPSFAEGFGLPLVQAMQSGCPVAYSRDTCLPEVMGDAGLSFNPRSVLDISGVLKKYWKDPKLCQHHRRLGLTRAKQFNWSLTAKQTLAIYHSTLFNEK